MYPNLAISQGLYPEHLGIEFLEIYDGEIVSVRVAEKKKPKKERDFVIVEGFKLAANGSQSHFKRKLLLKNRPKSVKVVILIPR